MVATSGARLLKQDAVKAMATELLPLATLATPNVDEAELLIGSQLTCVDDLSEAARAVHRTYGCAALIKGGHLRTLREAVDIFYDGETELRLAAPFVRNVSTHGTGCTYSAAIAAYVAKGLPLREAVTEAKNYITQAIATSVRSRAGSVLNSFWNTRPARVVAKA
jgi:hydroxymethylpyrimidine/phosphomethylpyrimidine kinase